MKTIHIDTNKGLSVIKINNLNIRPQIFKEISALKIARDKNL